MSTAANNAAWYGSENETAREIVMVGRENCEQKKKDSSD